MVKPMRVFIGIKIPANERLARTIGDFKKFKELKTVEPEKLHVTLKFLGEISDEQTRAVSEFLETLKGFGPFDVNVKGVGVFPDEREPRVIWVGIESSELIALNKRVEDGLEKIGFSRERRAFSPHITLARAKSRVGGGLKGILTDDEFFTFNATNVLLVKSEASANGHVYSDLKTVKL
ncbi:RNA 2',3'-cyclic phosphodiesterase [Candidatus Micrarchaeota archaeon]|nr:RNA 2',3'-cyclic phosphodiesterase [Candidatus Micrarchaeota archaeon]